MSINKVPSYYYNSTFQAKPHKIKPHLLSANHGILTSGNIPTESRHTSSLQVSILIMSQVSWFSFKLPSYVSFLIENHQQSLSGRPIQGHTTQKIKRVQHTCFEPMTSSLLYVYLTAVRQPLPPCFRPDWTKSASGAT